MDKAVAERKLLYSLKNSDVCKDFTIRIGVPYIVDENKVDFSVGDGLVGCHIETDGLPEEFHHDVYGVDELQAINIASNIEPYLKGLGEKYDIFWGADEPYFE